jgi:hypothetical protein
MIRPLLGLAVPIFALIATVLAAVRAQPFDDNALRASLVLPDCTLPCFMGIRPGVTARDEAFAILRAHPWVATVDTLLGERGLTWTWSGRQPAFLSGGHTENSLLIGDGIVRRIDLLTGESLATFLIVFGAPDSQGTTTWSAANIRTNTYTNFLSQVFTYDAYRMEVSALAMCPLSLHDQLALAGRISLFEQPEIVGFGYTYLENAPLVLYSSGEGCL